MTAFHYVKLCLLRARVTLCLYSKWNVPFCGVWLANLMCSVHICISTMICVLSEQFEPHFVSSCLFSVDNIWISCLMLDLEFRIILKLRLKFSSSKVSEKSFLEVSSKKWEDGGFSSSPESTSDLGQWKPSSGRKRHSMLDPAQTWEGRGWNLSSGIRKGGGLTATWFNNDCILFFAYH